MTRGWALPVLALFASTLAAVSATSGARAVVGSRRPQGNAPPIEVSGVWQTVTTDIRYPFNVTKCVQEGRSFGQWAPTFGSPWTFWLTQTGTTLSGTVQNSGPDNWCTPDPLPIVDGTIEGDVLSFRVETPSGSTIEFAGVVEADGSSISFLRSPVAPGAAAPAPNNFGPFSPETRGLGSRFVLERISPPAGNGCADGSPATYPLRTPRCERVDPQAPLFAAGSSRWIATDGVGFAPWTFDFTIGLHGLLTGRVAQGALDAATRTGPAPSGPFALVSGQADGRRLSFTIVSPDGTRVVTFSGVRRGADAIDFHRAVVRSSRNFVPDVTLEDLFGLTDGTTFTAWRAPTDEAAPPRSDLPSDATVALDAVDDRAASVPASPPDGSAAAPSAVARAAFVLIRYEVRPSFEGRLFILALDAHGQPIRQFEVLATPGPHVALWDLRPTGAGGATATDNNATEQDLRVAEARALIAADAIRLATDVPSEAAATGLSATLSAMLAGLGEADPTPADGRFVAPGADTIALARLDGGALTIVATRPCVVTAASGK